MRVTLFFSFLWIAVLCVSGANKYVRQGASGSANGTDWTNAYTELPVSLTRGDTYYVADGTYASRVCDEAASGTSVITIKKATVADHGTDTGWADTYGDGQATFAYQIRFKSPYWTFDGNTGSGGNPATYGFAVLAPADCSLATQHYFQFGTGVENVSNITVKHVSMTACGPSYNVEKIAIYMQGANVTNLTLNSIYAANFQGFLQTGAHDTVTAEYCYFTNHFSSAQHHGEWFSFTGGAGDPGSRATNVVIRYNHFMDTAGTGTIVANDNGNGAILAIDGMDVYGNVFRNCLGGNGTITSTTASGMAHVRVYNNTFISGSRWFVPVQSNASQQRKDYAVGNIAKNNLTYNQAAQLGDYATEAITHDYNAFFDCTNIPTEANGQTASGDPFQGLASLNFYTVSNTSAGVDLGSPYNVDMYGRTRATWTRGALEFLVTGTAPNKRKRGR
jgi:hypothetical protein